jgi:hypothetical protein
MLVGLKPGHPCDPIACLLGICFLTGATHPAQHYKFLPMLPIQHNAEFLPSASKLPATTLKGLVQVRRGYEWSYQPRCDWRELELS